MINKMVFRSPTHSREAGIKGFMKGVPQVRETWGRILSRWNTGKDWPTDLRRRQRTEGERGTKPYRGE